MKLNMILTLVTLTLTSGCALAPISEVCADATNYNQCYSDETAHRKAMDDWNDRIVAAQQKAMADYAKNMQDRVNQDQSFNCTSNSYGGSTLYTTCH